MFVYFWCFFSSYYIFLFFCPFCIHVCLLNSKFVEKINKFRLSNRKYCAYLGYICCCVGGPFMFLSKCKHFHWPRIQWSMWWLFTTGQCNRSRDYNPGLLKSIKHRNSIQHKSVLLPQLKSFSHHKISTWDCHQKRSNFKFLVIAKLNITNKKLNTI